MKFPFITLLLLICLSCDQKKEQDKPEDPETEEATEKTTYFLIRHSEKDRSNPDDQDPALEDAGFERAEKWADIFADIKLDAVYSSDFKRTIQTATPTAESKGLEIISYDPHGVYETNFIEDTKGKNILVVGHSNTIPKLANYLLDEEKYSDIPDDVDGRLYIITVLGKNKTSVMLNLE
ncbi:MAG: phosphoglycerate mutase family protein [Flavobacteriaceae bacterium]